MGARKIRTFKASFLVIGSRAACKAIDFLTLIVLARYLQPADFGLVAMAMTVVLIVEAICEMPLSAALLRQVEITGDMVDTALTLGIMRGLAIGAALALLSWPIARIYGDPALTPLVCALALAPVARGLVSPRMVFFARDLNYLPETILELAGKVTGAAAAIITVALTESFWSIAIATVASPLVMMAFSYVFAPTRVRFTLGQFPVFSSILGWNFVSQLIAAANWQMDRLLLPTFVGAGAFGGYAVSSDVAAAPVQAVIQPVSRPLYASIASIRGREQLVATYLNASAGVFCVLSPVYVLMALLGEPIVNILLGARWASAIPLFQALSLASILTLPTCLLWIFAFVEGKPGLVTLRAGAELAVFIPVALAGVLTWGMWGAVAAKFVAGALNFALGVAIVRRLLGVGVTQQLAALSGGVAANGLALAAAALAARHPGADLSDWPRLFVISFIYAAVYCLASLAVARACPASAQFQRMAIDFAASFLRSRSPGRA